MSKTVKWILAANLLVLAVLAFTYPQFMVGPGKLTPGHRALESDCFACHAPLAGATTEKCTTCHKPHAIGKLTTAGLPIAKPLSRTHFHQKLIRQDCMACHSDHSGVKRFHMQAHFNHDLLQVDARRDCQACHKAPVDTFHQRLTGNCSQCHSQQAWRPATFDHDRYFLLDGDHDTQCETCHVRSDYSRYTCYGCHEHTPANIRREHIEEGIRDFDNCVDCHRNAHEEDIRLPPGMRRQEGGNEGEED